MRRQIFMSATLGLLLVFAVTAAAQPSTKLEAAIPFDFIAGRTHLKAGVYNVKYLSANALIFRSADGKAKAIVLAPRGLTADNGQPQRILFHRYGDSYFLSQVWILPTSGRELDPTSAERSLAKALVARKSNSMRVVQVAAVPK